MTLQGSMSPADPLRFSEIQAEFAPQGSASNFRAYRKTAGIVDTNDFAPNVPSSGTMKFENFLGAQCITLAATINSYSPLTFDIHLERTHYAGGGFSFAYVDILLDSDGTAYYRFQDQDTPLTNFTSFTWKTGGGSASDYYAFMTTPTSGTFDTGTVGSALQLNTARQWTLQISSQNAGQVPAIVEGPSLQIRDINSNILASKTMRVYVEAWSDQF